MRRKSWVIVSVFLALLAAGVGYLSTNDPASATLPPVFVSSDVELFVLAAFGVFALFGIRHFVTDEPGSANLEAGSDRSTLVVLVRGLGGFNGFADLQALVREQYPTADLLTSTVKPTPLANIDPYRIANVMEHAINDAYADNRYERIVLVGYSLGAVVLRKAWVWGNGIDEDRTGLGRCGKREWVDRVERFVSLAGLNRGWSIDPRPQNMSAGRYFLYYVIEKVARLTGTGKLLLAVQRGAPFIADLRVQWIRTTRRRAEFALATKPPFVVHLLGDIDDVVAMEDSQDIAAAANTSFIKLRNTDHNSLAEVNGPDNDSKERREAIIRALVEPEEKLQATQLLEVVEQSRVQERGVRRAVFVYHGIRDYGVWTGAIKKQIATVASASQSGLVVSTPKYGYFPMLSFLLYWDRQRNVRSFMDEYTETLARYPDLADDVDYVGHSNGTYILASALHHYRTIRVRNVFFAGSVVPRRFDWQKFIDAGRVAQVRNVVASADWVVAYFPRFFEQIADWADKKPETGMFDIGSAGFRGFAAAGDPGNKVRNLEFVAGGHGEGVNVGNAKRLAAIVDYITTGDDEKLSVFENTRTQSKWVDRVSNVSWLVWLALAAILVLLGCWLGQFGSFGVAAYVFLLVLLLSSV